MKYIYISESLCCTPESNTVHQLYFKKNNKNRQKVNFHKKKKKQEDLKLNEERQLIGANTKMEKMFNHRKIDQQINK